MVEAAWFISYGVYRVYMASQILNSEHKLHNAHAHARDVWRFTRDKNLEINSMDVCVRESCYFWKTWLAKWNLTIYRLVVTHKVSMYGSKRLFEQSSLEIILFSTIDKHTCYTRTASLHCVHILT